MGFAAKVMDQGLAVSLTGWDRLMNWRSEVDFAWPNIVSAEVVSRSALEPLIDHRALGFGTHNGAKRPNRRRVGTMRGRTVPGKQFWAVPAGLETAPLLVINLRDHKFERVVLATDEPAQQLARIGLETS